MSTHAPDTASATGRRQEDAHLRQIEEDMRRFLAEYEKHPESYFAPPTVRLAQHVRPVLEQLDEVRARRAKKT